MWIINFETGFFTSVTLPRVASTTLKALDFGFSIQISNAFVISTQLLFIHLCEFLKNYRSIANASYKLIAYLPSDDVYFKNHLEILYDCLINTDNVIFAFSNAVCRFNEVVKNNYGIVSNGITEGYPLQLVQVLHFKTSDKWTERSELVTDNLNIMFWNKLLGHQKNTEAVATGEVIC